MGSESDERRERTVADESLAAFVPLLDALSALGYGVGARFRTPVGPVRADLAYGVDTRQLRLHFSVGFTF